MTKDAGASRSHTLGRIPLNTHLVFTHSPLQTAVARRALPKREDHFFIGHRSAHGDVSFPDYVLNEVWFCLWLVDHLDKSTSPIDVYLPHSLNLVYFICRAHKSVRQINYIDEGTLTYVFATTDLKPRLRWPAGMMLTMAHAAVVLPRRLKPQVLHRMIRVYLATFHKHLSRDITHANSDGIRVDRKTGRIFVHFPDKPAKSLDIQFVRLDDASVAFDRDLEGAAVVFVPILTDAEIPAFVDKVVLSSTQTEFLLRLHPAIDAVDLAAFLSRLALAFKARARSAKTVNLSEEHETAFELYARGVRTFILENSTLILTVDSYPEHFRGLRIVNISEEPSFWKRV
jgi:hypothetical protein